MAADLSSEVTAAPMGLGGRGPGNPTFGITVGASPFTYTAPYSMAVAINGGTVSVISYGRGPSLTVLGLLGGLIELNPGDSVRVTYVAAPTMTAIPR